MVQLLKSLLVLAGSCSSSPIREASAVLQTVRQVSPGDEQQDPELERLPVKRLAKGKHVPKHVQSLDSALPVHAELPVVKALKQNAHVKEDKGLGQLPKQLPVKHLHKDNNKMENDKVEIDDKMETVKMETVKMENKMKNNKVENNKMENNKMENNKMENKVENIKVQNNMHEHAPVPHLGEDKKADQVHIPAVKHMVGEQLTGKVHAPNAHLESPLNKDQIKQAPKFEQTKHVPKFDQSKHRVLIFAPPKTASTSLASGFQQCMNMTFFAEQNQTSYPQGLRTHMGSVASDFLSKTREGETVWVITPVRHIFGHAVSGYFQRAETNYPKEEFIKMPMSRLQTDFESEHFGYSYNWRTTQFNRALGFDLAKIALNGKNKFSPPAIHAQKMWHGRKINTFVVRFEDIGKWDSMLSETFPCFKMQADNVGADKWYHEVYEKFRASFSPSEAMLQKMNTKDELSVFYTEEEQANFMKSFQKKLTLLQTTNSTLID